MRHPAATTPLLYVPGDRPSLATDLSRAHAARPYSIGVCLEDAVRSENRAQARLAVAEALGTAKSIATHVMIRPDSTESLRHLVDILPMDRIAGFIMPKASVGALEQWLDLAGDKLVMPIMETAAMLDQSEVRVLAELCAAHPARVPCARIGANDLFAVLGGLRRPKGRTVYETPLGAVIDGFVAAFGPRGVPLCGPVMDRFSDDDTPAREVREDVQRGLFGKSAIHPRQLAVIWQSMLPCVEELEQARAIVSPSAPAVFSMHGTMLEPACHRRWAEQVLEVDRMGCVPSHVGVSETAFEFRAD